MEEIKRTNNGLSTINTLKTRKSIKVEIKWRKKIYQVANMTQKNTG